MLNRDHVFEAFRKALAELKDTTGVDGLRPRTVAVRAHALYCAGLGPLDKKPVLETFRKFATGKLAFPEIVTLLEDAGIHPTVRTPVDRKRLRLVFEEAIQRLEARLMRGQAKPLQIARRAYELYTRDAEDGTHPSHHTFERLIYGKAADPEILTLIESALRKRD